MMATVNKTDPERIGDYIVHPVASMFPLIQSEAEWENFKGNIDFHGQLEPIIVQGNVLLDGRNRLRACLELRREPIIEEYRAKINPNGGEVDVVTYIISKNLQRRDLTNDQRATIRAKIRAYRQEQRALEIKIESGKEGGRGKKKNHTTNSLYGSSAPKLRTRQQRTTAGQIAAECKTSYQTAERALAVVKRAPEPVVNAVIAGKMPLKEAVKHAKPAGNKSSKTKVTKGVDLSAYAVPILKVLHKSYIDCPGEYKQQLIHILRKEIDDLCRA